MCWKEACTLSLSHVSLVSVQNSGNVTCRGCICVRIAQAVNWYTTAAWKCVSRDQCVLKHGGGRYVMSVRKICRAVCWLCGFWQQLVLGWAVPLPCIRKMCPSWQLVVPDLCFLHGSRCRLSQAAPGWLYDTEKCSCRHKSSSHQSVPCPSFGQAKLKYLRVFCWTRRSSWMLNSPKLQTKETSLAS